MPWYVGTNILEEHTAFIFKLELKMVAVCSCETLRLTFPAAQCRNPEEYKINLCSHESLKS
jgi:hypothetical protein